MIEEKDKKKSEKNNKIDMMRLPRTIVIALTLWLTFMIVFFAFNDIKFDDFYSLKDHMTVDAYHNDGRVEHIEAGEYGATKKGEKVKVYIDIPQDAFSCGSELYIPLYNSIVDVYLDDECIYKDEYNPDNMSAHYGARVYEIMLPDDAPSKQLMLDITAVVNKPSSDLSKIGLLPANQSWKNVLSRQSVIYSSSLSLMVLSIICILYFTVRSISLKKLQLGLPIALFEFLINSWFFGSLGMFRFVIGNEEFNAKIEYYSLYMSSIPLTVFIYMVIDKKLFKRIVTYLSMVFDAFYLVATVIELSSIQLNYSDMLKYLHALMGVLMLTLVLALFFGVSKNNNRYIFILRYGILISIMCGIMELVRFNLTKYIAKKAWFATHGLSSVGILIIAVSLFIYLVSVSAEEYMNKIEKEQLMLLAFNDALTQMANRAECYRRIDDMEAEGVKEYTMIFIDLNYLKVANDKYGHETGDRLLKTIAKHIKAHFMDDAFCARWGGDEFVACVFGDEKLALEKIDAFNKDMDEENASGSFEFPVSAACGYVHSDEENYIKPIEAIREADAIMYDNKKRMKAAMGQA